MPERNGRASEAKEGLSDEVPHDPDIDDNITKRAEAIPRKAKELQDHSP